MAGKGIIVIDAGEAPHMPTPDSREKVKYMVACGLEMPHICHLLGATPYEVNLHYKDELAFGLPLVNAEVAMRMLKAIEAGDMQSAQYWLKSRAQWIVPTKIEAQVEATVEHKIKRDLMDSIIDMMTVPKRKEAAAETVSRANTGSKRVN